MPESNGSKVAGFRERDFNIQCPTTGEVCTVQQYLVLQYVGDVCPESDPREAEVSRNILIAKLLEYRLVGKLISCDEPSVCSVRESMNNSVPRQRTVTFFRGIREFIKTRG